ncbi:MAG: class I SAM-dependent methyltransferase [Alphaproteobacteria bacterium]|nr:class I SAM-dependent methyltransferase [Alphaproteobacteria bacterium]
MSLRSAVMAQFKKPTGLLGLVVGWLMSVLSANRRRNRWIVGLLKLSGNARVLEWGCGPGIGIAACLENCPSARILAVDHSSLMVRQASARHAAAIKAGKLRIIEGSLKEALPHAPFDAIFSSNVLQFVEGKAEAIALMKNMLAPGGVAASGFQPRAANARPEDALAWAEEIKALHERAGFARVKVEILDLKPMPVACVLGYV